MRPHSQSNPRFSPISQEGLTLLTDSTVEGDDETVLQWFEAKFPGKCKGCNRGFAEGADIAYLDGTLVGRDCCGGISVAMHSVVPRGMSIKDTCPDCFLIHSPLQKECE